MKKVLAVAVLLALDISSRGAPAFPSGAELKKLTDKSLLSFDNAVYKADFTDFYKSTSKLWQAETTPDKLKAAFQRLIDGKFRIEGAIKNLEPTFEPAPAMDADGFLVVQLAYPIERDSLNFRLKYNNEEGAWRLAGLNVDLKKGAAPTVPSEAELKKLADKSLLSFNSALQKKDFGDFYKSLSSLWQEQTTAEKLKELFQSFIDQKVNIASVVKDLKPSFEPPAEINSDGLLVLQGSYPVEPDELTFELKYLDEKGTWKLAGIHVNANRAPKDESKN
jgi:Ca2+-binding EF-hand superfamily protein